MWNSLYAVIASAFIAAIVTIVTAPGPVTAGPLSVAAAAPMQACAQRPWPYLRCIGTQYGNQKIRLVTSERLSD